MWIICNANKPYDMQHFQNAAISLSIDLKIIDPTKIVVLSEDSQIKFYYNNEMIQAPKYMLNWNGCNNSKLEEQIETCLIKTNTKVLNKINEINLIQDKFKWQVETKLPTVKSMKIHASNLSKSINIIEDNFNYPLILKSDTGSLGLGVYKCDNRQMLSQQSELINLLDKSFKVHIEDYIDYKRDVRMYIVNNNYYLMERIPTNDFRANIAMDGKPRLISKTTVTDEIFTMVRSEYDSLVLGVDILFTEDSYYICEINSAPSFKGLEQVHDIDIAKEILKAIK